MTKPTVSVLGLGAMGLPMASWLASSGFPVRGFDVSQERMLLGRAESVEVFGTAREAATGADVVLVAVRNLEQLDALLWGSDGIAEVLRPGAAILLTSTIGIAAVQQVGERLAQIGLELVDAPVSGGPVRAGKGDLLMTAGATDAAWALTQPVMAALASTLVRIGNAPGDGQKMKTVNQLLCGVHIAVAAEALSLAQKAGIDGALLFEIMGGSAASSWMLRDRGPRMLDDEPPVASAVDIFVKDLGIVNKAARAHKLATPVAAAAEQLFLLGQGMGLAAVDDSAVIRVVAPERLS